MPRFRKDKWNNARILLSSPNIPNLYEKGFTKIDDRILHQVYASHKKYNSTRLIIAIQGSHFQPNADIIDQLMYFMFANMPNHHLYRTHTYSRYFHQEVRYPFLDDDLIEFIFSIPGSIKTKNGTRKHLLKEISFDYLPDRIIKQKKKGLIAPSGYWLKHPLQSFSQEQYESLYQRSLFNADKLKQLITFNERYYPKQNDRWVSTAIWLKNFVD
jgi:asparagine synthase (glutamine-hydrolysing)